MSDRPGHIVWPSYDAIPAEARAYPDPSDGQYKRNVPLPLGGADLNGERIAVYEPEVRPVALSLEEAREHMRDYFHPGDCPCGQSFETWMRNGMKPERERPENVRENVVLEQSASTQSMSVREFRAAGGRWPPEGSWRDDYLHLLARRDELERKISGDGAQRLVVEAFGGSTDRVDADERYRGELKRIMGALAGIGAPGGPGGRARLDEKPEWRALMRDVEAYLKKPGTTLENAVKRFDLMSLGDFDNDLDAEIEGEDVEGRKIKAAVGKLKRWRTIFGKLPESKKKA